MDTNSRSLSDLDGGYPLASVCEQYLDESTLGTKGDVDSFIERLIALYKTDEYSGWTNPSDPAEYARAFAEKLDPVTLNIINASWQRGLIEDHVLVKTRAQGYGPEQARNYTLLMIGINDLPQKAGATRQFNGLHRLLMDEYGNPVDRLDLSTDESYRGNVALLRYSVTVTGEWSDIGGFRGWGEFFLMVGEDIVVDPEMHKLLWEYPTKADWAASVVLERRSQDVAIFRQMLLPDVLSGRITAPLIDGSL